MATVPARISASGRSKLAALILLGAAVAAALGVYARVHMASGRAAFTLGFSGVLQMKVWLTCGVLLLALAQLTSALWMWGRLPGAGPAPRWIPLAHRWTGTAAFVLSLPVAFSCIWSLGFETSSWRVVLHGVAGCLFYGAYAAKMLGLRLNGLPGWALPVLGGLVFSLIVVLWLTGALWFFTRSGLPLT